MKHNFLKKLIATSVITSSIFSICPTTVLATGVNYAGFGQAQTNGQWSKQGENWYYYVGGQLQTGWIYDKTGWYYTDKNGVMQTGVVQIGGNIYLLADSGVMQTGTVVINGKVYTAGADGVFYGEDLPMPTKSFDWYGTNDNIKHPSQVIDSSEDDSSSTNPATAYDHLAPKEKFQITFKDDDGEDLKIKNVVDGQNITLYKPTKKGYKFVEWNTKKNGNGDSYDYDEDIQISKNITLYAMWEEVEVTDDNAEELGVVKVKDITITSGDDKITTDNGTLKLSAKVLPVNATNDDVEWSVENKTGKATISSNGVLTAETNGTVIVKAAAEDGSSVYDTMVITISGQKSEEDDPSNPNNPTNPSDGEVEDPVITGDEVMINNATTNTIALEGNSYSAIRIDRSQKTTLKNVKVESLIINGGTELELQNCKVNKLYVLQPDGVYKLTINNGTTISVTNIESGTELSGSGYKTVNVNTTDVVKVQSSAVIDTLNVKEEISKVKVDGSIGRLNVSSTAENSVFEGNGTITKLVAGADIKVGVQNVTATEGTGTVILIERNKDLVGKAQALEIATKALEKAETTKLQTDIDEAKSLIDNVDDEIYEQEKEKLNDRLNRLNIAYAENEKVAKAKEAVKDLKNAVAVDPIVNEFVYNGYSADRVKFDDDLTTEDLLKDAQDKVYKLTANTSDRNNLQSELDRQKNIIVKESALVKIIESESYTDNKPTVEDYTTASIVGVTTGESLSLTNRYVNDLRSNIDSGFISKISADLLKDQDGNFINTNGIVNALETDRKLINEAKDKANSVISKKKTLTSKISDAEEACNKLYGTLGNENKLRDGVVYSDIAITKTKLESIKSQISELEKLDSDQIAEYKVKYNKILERLKNAAMLLCERDVNALYKNNSVSGNIISDNVDTSVIEAARQQLEKVIELFGMGTGDIEYATLTTYSGYVSNAKALYDKKSAVFNELKNMIKVDDACAAYKDMSLTADSNNTTYTASIKLPSIDGSKYSTDGSGNIIYSGASTQYFITTGDSAVIRVNIANSGNVSLNQSPLSKDIKVARKYTDSASSTIKVTLDAKGIEETPISVTQGTNGYQFKFKVSYNNGTYTISVYGLTQTL